VDRSNPDLDNFMAGTAAKTTKRRRRRVRLTTDQARRMAFRVLALLSKFDAPQRAQVLAKAGQLNKS
jgi:hypothetical protein